ncbi:MAG: hypothetical protein U1E05_14110 [Patescibacteria group bacterium]|nr:hypothetical protein [Patescibacteria group bacterium]
MSEFGMLVLGGLIGWLGRFWADRMQRRELFDHQLRLEKEYQIYAELWDRLFEFKRTMHDAFDSVGGGNVENPWQQFADTFNSFQAVVRRNEPFMAPRVFAPANEIVTQGHRIDSIHKRLLGLDEYRSRVKDDEADEKAAEKQCAADTEREHAMDEIDRLFPKVRDAIRQRITVERRHYVAERESIIQRLKRKWSRGK